MATTQPAGVQAAPGEQVAYAATAPAASTKPMGNAASSLLDKAENQRRAGDLDGAASTLERALRIESRHPLLWNRLAQVRMQQQNYSLAAELASKSNTLAGSDSSLKRSNYLIIADARRASGDVAGAGAAQSRADALRWSLPKSRILTGACSLKNGFFHCRAQRWALHFACFISWTY